jgi:tetratricopeptide (TPR) repeat protein
VEGIFIQKIFALTEAILRGDFQFEPTRQELQNHLAKAQKMGSSRYEAEVLNTLGILHLMVGNSSQYIQYFLQGFEKASQTDDADLKTKLLNNLSEVYMLIWDIDSSNRYLDQGIALGEQHQLKTLVMLYLYSNKINYWVLQGDFEQAATLLDDAWRLAETPNLLKYSKYEYLQVIFLLRNLRAMVEIALNHCEAALSPLQIAVGLAKETKNPDFHILAHLSQLYHTVICKHDDASAAQWEKAAAEAGGGELPFNPALNAALFMMHNNQPRWAEKFANMVLEQAARGKPIPPAATAHAERILEAVQKTLPEKSG